MHAPEVAGVAAVQQIPQRPEDGGFPVWRGACSEYRMSRTKSRTSPRSSRSSGGIVAFRYDGPSVLNMRTSTRKSVGCPERGGKERATQGAASPSCEARKASQLVRDWLPAGIVAQTFRTSARIVAMLSLCTPSAFHSCSAVSRRSIESVTL